MPSPPASGSRPTARAPSPRASASIPAGAPRPSLSPSSRASPLPTWGRAVGDHSAIEWTDATWNPVTGCTKISPGCKHCYAERLAIRLKAMGNPRYGNGFAVTLHADQLDLPLRWRRPKRIFVNSMSDLFHESIPDDYIRRVFDVMGQAPWHTFQILTKRAPRLAQMAPTLSWPGNVWQGVS